ncbi:MAG: hypothetical protein R6V04_04970 [bacterium]
MGIWKIFIRSIKTLFQHKRLWIFLFLVELIIALILINPISSQFNEMFSNSLSADKILQGQGTNSIFEFMVHKAETIDIQKQIILFTGLLYLLITIFFNAGIISSLLEKRDFRGAFFFQSGGHFFGRLLRLFFWSVPFYLITLILYSILGKVFKLISGESEPLIFIFFIVNFLILVFLFLFIKMVFDYTKIALVSEDKRSIIKTNFKTWKFVWKNKWKSLSLFYLIVFLFIILGVIYLSLSSLLHINTWIAIILLFILQQLFIFSRTGIKLIYFSSLIYLFQNVEEPLLKAWYKDDSYVDKMIT